MTTPVTTTVPLFPLGVVLVPGLLLPLNVFEPRYRCLVEDLLELPESTPKRFGVICIRQGREVGADSVDALYDIGCTATVTRIDPQDDGRYELLTVGTERFRLRDLDHSRAYLQGQVAMLGDPMGDAAAANVLVSQVQAAFRTYLAALGAARGHGIEVPELPDDPQLLCWLVAATAVIDRPVRQQLLAVDDTAARLAAELALLRGETGLLNVMAASPAPELTRVELSPN